MQEQQTDPNKEINLLYKPQEENLKEVQPKKGFTILDSLVIIAALCVVAFLGYLVLNPEKEGAESRNIHRSADISSVLTTLSTYISNTREIPQAIPVSSECIFIGNEICKMGPYDCKGLVDLSFLSDMVSGESSVLTLPSDPASKSLNGTGYYVSHDGNGNLTVCAPYAERNVEVSFTKFVL